MSFPFACAERGNRHAELFEICRCELQIVCGFLVALPPAEEPELDAQPLHHVMLHARADFPAVRTMHEARIDVRIELGRVQHLRAEGDVVGRAAFAVLPEIAVIAIGDEIAVPSVKSRSVFGVASVVG